MWCKEKYGHSEPEDVLCILKVIWSCSAKQGLNYICEFSHLKSPKQSGLIIRLLQINIYCPSGTRITLLWCKREWYTSHVYKLMMHFRGPDRGQTVLQAIPLKSHAYSSPAIKNYCHWGSLSLGKMQTLVSMAKPGVCTTFHRMAHDAKTLGGLWQQNISLVCIWDPLLLFSFLKLAHAVLKSCIQFLTNRSYFYLWLYNHYSREC